jgi:hypothetical protein
VGQRKALLRSHDDKSPPAQYPNTILHARGSKFGQLGKGDRPRCLICRHLCAGDAINRFACPNHFQDFGWACHLRGNQDPQRIGVVESSKRQQECLICRKFREKNPLHGYLCKGDRLHTRHVDSALVGSTLADDFTVCWLSAPHSNGRIRARHLMSRRLKARSASMKCTICHRECYESRFLGTFFCSMHAHLGLSPETRSTPSSYHSEKPRPAGTTCGMQKIGETFYDEVQ